VSHSPEGWLAVGQFQSLPVPNKLGFSAITFARKLKIKNLQDIQIFVLTADHGSLSAAARILELSPAPA
jgi:hypothetical protein